MSRLLFLGFAAGGPTSSCDRGGLLFGWGIFYDSFSRFGCNLASLSRGDDSLRTLVCDSLVFFAPVVVRARALLPAVCSALSFASGFQLVSAPRTGSFRLFCSLLVSSLFFTDMHFLSSGSRSS